MILKNVVVVVAVVEVVEGVLVDVVVLKIIGVVDLPRPLLEMMEVLMGLIIVVGVSRIVDVDLVDVVVRKRHMGIPNRNRKQSKEG